MVEVLKDGKIAITTMFTARSSKERYLAQLHQRVSVMLTVQQWQDYNPWDLTGRLDANMNLYEGPGGCSVFRTFQSWLGLSRHGPQQGA